MAAGATATVAVGDLVNEGTVRAPSGTTLVVSDVPGNLAGTTLTGGTWSAAGTVELPGTIHTLAAGLTLSGAGEIEDSRTSANALAGLSTITSAASFTLDDSAYLATAAVTSAGRITVGTKGDAGDAVNWQPAGSFTQTGGSFTFEDPSACINVGAQGTVRLTGGTISGYGMVTGTTTVSGTAVVSPTLDGAPATFNLAGSYTQVGGTLATDVADPSGTASAGVLAVSGAVHLGGALAVTSTGHVPVAGSTLAVVTGTSVSGGFASVRSAGVASFATAYGATTASVVAGPPQGFWLAGADGTVVGAGTSVAAGGTAVPRPIRWWGSCSSATGGYYLVQRDGEVTARGGARAYGDLPRQGVRVSDIVAVAPTHDGDGYWLVGADGGEFAFGDAAYHGSLPGLGIHVDDVVGMVATPTGAGYLLVGADGGVFAFGASYHGTLLGLRHPRRRHRRHPGHRRRGGVRPGGRGRRRLRLRVGRRVPRYVAPVRGITVDDIVGLALTSGGAGYWMAGADGRVYAFGNALAFATPAGVGGHLPVAGIAGG